jgi:hypothetical protein
MISRAQRKLLHSWNTLVIVKQHLVQIGRTDGPAEYLSQILAPSDLGAPPGPVAAFGVWCVRFGVWCLVFGVWCLVFGVCGLVRREQGAGSRV